MPAGLWQSVHIDDLRRSKDMISDLTALQNLTISQVFSQDAAAARGELCAGERAAVAPHLVLQELLVPGTACLMTVPAQHLVWGGHHTAPSLYLIHYYNFMSSRKLIWYFSLSFLTQLWHLHC